MAWMRKLCAYAIPAWITYDGQQVPFKGTHWESIAKYLGKTRMTLSEDEINALKPVRVWYDFSTKASLLTFDYSGFVLSEIQKQVMTSIAEKAEKQVNRSLTIEVEQAKPRRSMTFQGAADMLAAF